jgi:hypothetical protein
MIELAREGKTSQQISDAIGGKPSADRIRLIFRDLDITIQADKVMARRSKGYPIDTQTDRIVESVSSNARFAADTNVDKLDPTLCDEWVTMIRTSTKLLNTFAKRLEQHATTATKE